MTLYLVNAFSINMLPPIDIGHYASVHFERIDSGIAGTTIAYHMHSNDFVNAIGHADMARVIGEIIGHPDLEANRVSVTLEFGKDVLIVAQYRGPRLPEDATKLPEGATIEFWEVT